LVIHYIEVLDDVETRKRKYPTKLLTKLDEWYENDLRSDEEIDNEVADLKTN